MALDLVALGRRLGLARENAGLSQEQGSQAIGLSRSALSLIESGDRPLSTLELAGLAKLYGRPIGWFFQETDGVEAEPVAWFRVSEEFSSSPQLREAIEGLLGICREGAKLEQMLKRPQRKGPPAYSPGEPKSYSEAVEHGLRIAAEERKRLDLGHSPISDIAELIASQGVWAASSNMPDQMSGLFLRHSDVGLAIIVNGAHISARKRFSYAHEYAHALCDRDQTVTVTTRQNSKELIERRANAFAAAFLMPEHGVRELLECVRAGEPSRRVFTTYDVASDVGTEAEKRSAPGANQLDFTHVALIAYHFRVSYQAACYRLKDLGYLNRDEMNLLLSREDSHGRRYLELLPGGRHLYARESDGRALVEQLVPLVIDALKADEISESQVRSITGTLSLEPGATETILELAATLR